MPNMVDLTGQQFGRLIVIKRVEDYISPSGKSKDTQWLCRCLCEEHNEIIVPKKRLKDGVTKSCGCLRKEIAAKISKSRRKTNLYDLSGDFGIGYTQKGEQFYFDLEDYDKIKDYCWGYNYYGYVYTNMREGDKRKNVTLHMFVMPPAPDGMVIDHIIHPENPTEHKKDNRKSNLRYVTRAQNAQNQVPLRKTNTSGHKGVTWHKGGLWKASISANGEHFTKYFKADKYEEACDWYDEMAEKLHKEYQYQSGIEDDECACGF